MPSAGRPAGQPVHATAVALGSDALVIVGASGSGKSRLALALIGASARHLRIRLIGDDRVLLTQRMEGLVVRGHPRILGFIEWRGLGIVASPFVERAPVRAIVSLGSTTSLSPLLQNFPCFSIVTLDDIESERDRLLLWWRGASTTPRAKPSAAA